MALLEIVKRHCTGHNILWELQSISKMFPICLKANLEGHLRPLSLLEAVQRGQSLGEDWQIDFTCMPPCKGYQYRLVFCRHLYWIDRGLPY